MEVLHLVLLFGNNIYNLTLKVECVNLHYTHWTPVVEGDPGSGKFQADYALLYPNTVLVVFF